MYITITTLTLNAITIALYIHAFVNAKKIQQRWRQLQEYDVIICSHPRCGNTIHYVQGVAPAFAKSHRWSNRNGYWYCKYH